MPKPRRNKRCRSPVRVPHERPYSDRSEEEPRRAPFKAQPQRPTQIRCTHADPAATASRCVPHAAVPHLVAAWVVLPFLAPDVVLAGGSDLSATVCVNAPAPFQVAALHGLVTEARGRGLELRFEHTAMLHDLLCGLCAVPLPKADLECLSDVISTVAGGIGESDDRPLYVLLAQWCEFRLGWILLGTFLLQSKAHGVVSKSKAVFSSQVAVDEFFLPAASMVTPQQVHCFTKFFYSTDCNKLDTVEFRDRFFSRLLHSQEIDAKAMTALYFTLERFPVLCSEPAFLLGACVSGLTFARRHCQEGELRGYGLALLTMLCSVLKTATAKPNGPWPIELARAARDSFFIPVADALVTVEFTFDGLSESLQSMTQSDAGIAALFCTAEVRDQFFISVLKHATNGEAGCCGEEVALNVSKALENIAAAVPRAQLQEVFATPAFRDKVIVPLVRTATRGENELSGPNAVRSSRATLCSVRRAFIAIAQCRDFSLHETFSNAASNALILGPLAGCSVLPSELFETLQTSRAYYSLH